LRIKEHEGDAAKEAFSDVDGSFAMVSTLSFKIGSYYSSIFNDYEQFAVAFVGGNGTFLSE